jgi:hypothetical protein
MVKLPKTSKNLKLIHLVNIKFIRIRRYTPAVTKVEEWTNEETGVGAAIAAGSQAENGIWALLVIAAATLKTKTKTEKLLEGRFVKKANDQLPH